MLITTLSRLMGPARVVLLHRIIGEFRVFDS